MTMPATLPPATDPAALALGQHAGTRELIRLALAEDVGRGDLTTEATVAPDAVATAEIRQKAPGVVCGLPVAQLVFAELDPRVRVIPLVEEGSWGERRVVARLEGPARSLLSGERTALNFLQRLSGVATASRRAAEAVAGTGATVMDTRKTTPGHRVLEKYAVRVGGGRNHRAGLDDGILIKENHIRAAGGIGPAVAAAKRRAAPLGRRDRLLDHPTVIEDCRLEIEDRRSDMRRDAERNPRRARPPPARNLERRSRICDLQSPICNLQP